MITLYCTWLKSEKTIAKKKKEEKERKLYVPYNIDVQCKPYEIIIPRIFNLGCVIILLGNIRSKRNEQLDLVKP